MKTIPLQNEKVALVDDEDFERLNQYHWFAESNCGRTWYAVRKIKVIGSKKYKQKRIWLHREIIGDPPMGYVTDHIDGNGLNNQKNNLRFVTIRQNSQNRRIRGSSQYPGVSWSRKSKRWEVHIQIQGQSYNLGLFHDELEAFKAYANAVQQCGEEICNGTY